MPPPPPRGALPPPPHHHHHRRPDARPPPRHTRPALSSSHSTGPSRRRRRRTRTRSRSQSPSRSPSAHAPKRSSSSPTRYQSPSPSLPAASSPAVVVVATLRQASSRAQLSLAFSSLDLRKTVKGLAAKEVLVEAGIGDCLVTIINSISSSELLLDSSTFEIIAEACHCIRLFLNPPHECDALKPKMLSQGVGVCAIGLVRRHLPGSLQSPDALNCVTNALDIIWNLASNDNRAPLMELGAGEVICQSLAQHMSSAYVVKPCAGALRNLASEEKNQQGLFDLGAGALIVQVLNIYQYDKDILWHTCGAVSNLTISLNRAAMCSMGAGEAVVGAMAHHACNKKIIEKGCLALQHLSGAPENLQRLHSIGAVQQLVRALSNQLVVRKSGYMLPEVAYPACAALGHFCANAEIRNVLAAGPLLATEWELAEMVLHAIKRKDCGVEEVGCLALAELAGAGKDARLKLFSLGLAECCVDILRRVAIMPPEGMSTMGNKIAVAACKALHALSMAHENQARLFHKGATALIVENMMRLPQNARLAEFGCGALLGMAVDANIKSVCFKQSGKAVLEALQRHMDDARVVQSACGAIRNMAMDNQVAVAWVAAEAFAPCLLALKKHVNDEEACLRACGAVRYLAEAQPSLLRDDGSDAQNVMRSVQKLYPAMEHAVVLVGLLESVTEP